MDNTDTKESLFKEITKRLFTMLKSEVKLERQSLVDGTVIEIEGDSAYVIVEDEGQEQRLPAPVGEHELEDGKILVIQEEGKISEIKEKEMAEETENKEMEFASKEEVAELSRKVDELIAKMNPKEDEKELSEEVKTEETKVEASKVEKKDNESEEIELSKVEKVTHSPEKEVKQKRQTLNKVYGTTKDRVFARIAALK